MLTIQHGVPIWGAILAVRKTIAKKNSQDDPSIQTANETTQQLQLNRWGRRGGRLSTSKRGHHTPAPEEENDMNARFQELIDGKGGVGKANSARLVGGSNGSVRHLEESRPGLQARHKPGNCSSTAFQVVKSRVGPGCKATRLWAGLTLPATTRRKGENTGA